MAVLWSCDDAAAATPATEQRPPIRIISRRRQPADVLQELAIRSPADFAAILLIARAALDRIKEFGT